LVFVFVCLVPQRVVLASTCSNAISSRWSSYVLTPQEYDDILHLLQPEAFVEGQGYQNTSAYRVNPGYAGLSLNDLASGSIVAPPDYHTLMGIRERIRQQVETSLNLCPGTLHVDFTHWAQKTPGGFHASHADNCFQVFSKHEASGRALASCDSSKGPYRYASRVAASILYLNDEGFEGGEFYWADLSNGDPAILVRPKPGRLVFFTAGPENLHGALPVRQHGGEDDENCPLSRRLALAMWYVTDDSPEEFEPIQIPVEYNVQRSWQDLYSHLLVENHNPAWTPMGGDDEKNALKMVFRDRQAMFKVTMDETLIVIERHGGNPSRQHQLQESAILQSFFDDLQALAADDAKQQPWLKIRDVTAIP
jgi:hypothetical protein